MGRECKRVPLDFDWPLNKVWKGYVRPEALDGETCPDCYIGNSNDAMWLAGIAYLLTALADDFEREQPRKRDMHPYLEMQKMIAYVSGVKARPSAKFVEFVDRLAPEVQSSFVGRQHYGMVHRLLELAGYTSEEITAWESCPKCGGHGSLEKYEGQREDAEAWEPSEPPVGEGWQMWETVSEGSPCSPVFETPEELARYCADNVSTFGDHMGTYEKWLPVILGKDMMTTDLGNGMIGI